MTYQARPAALDEARRHLLPVWSAALPSNADPAEKLRWFYDDTPHGPGQVFLLEQAGGAGDVVGGAGVGVRTIIHRGRRLRTALFADLAVVAAHRSVFPALLLAGVLRRHVDATFDLGYGFPNRKAVPIYRRAGYRELGAMTRYVRVLRSAPYLQRYLHRAAFARTAGKVVDQVLRSVAQLAERRVRSECELRWLGGFDSQFDALWAESRDSYPVLGERTSELLRWRFRSQPGACYRIAGVFSVPEGQLRAYAVLRDVGGVAELADIFGPTTRELDRLLRCLVPDLDRRGMRAITFNFLGAPQVPPLLSAHGFFARPLAARTVAITLGTKRPEIAELQDPSLWYLTDFDEVS